MDVFQLRDRVIDDYKAYIQSFLRIADPGIKRWVEEQLDEGRLWPDPLVQLNPSFAPGTTVEELAAQEVLHPECARIFRRGKDREPSEEQPLRLHRHQQEAIEAASTGASYVLTTGTGSGKSLAYFVPIVDHVLRHGSGRGVKAIVVYPMNALCNSQMEELRKFLIAGFGEGRRPVTFERYTGQESRETRERIAANPPDVLLTNYVMLELLMTRFDPNDRQIIKAAEGLEFLVLDKLHTYRGRQGADVAMLVRRVRERLGAPTMRCVGTSATVAGSGTREERHQEVAEIATRLFGTNVRAEHVIGETLRLGVIRDAPSTDELRLALAGPPFPLPGDRTAAYATLACHPLAAWTETSFGIQRDEQGRLERKPPSTLDSAAGRLAEETGVDLATCRAHLQAILLAGYATDHPETGRSLFAFRLHQFVSRGDTVYSSLATAPDRHLAMEGQRFVPGSRDRRLYPLAFCRECGQEYAVVDDLATFRVTIHGQGEPRDQVRSTRRLAERPAPQPEHRQARAEGGQSGDRLVQPAPHQIGAIRAIQRSAALASHDLSPPCPSSIVSLAWHGFATDALAPIECRFPLPRRSPSAPRSPAARPAQGGSRQNRMAVRFIAMERFPDPVQSVLFRGVI
jgi:ATP-dependent helicase YprA (DUF1998 family)